MTASGRLRDSHAAARDRSSGLGSASRASHTATRPDTSGSRASSVRASSAGVLTSALRPTRARSASSATSRPLPARPRSTTSASVAGPISSIARASRVASVRARPSRVPVGSIPTACSRTRGARATGAPSHGSVSSPHGRSTSRDSSSTSPRSAGAGSNAAAPTASRRARSISCTPSGERLIRRAISPIARACGESPSRPAAAVQRTRTFSASSLELETSASVRATAITPPDSRPTRAGVSRRVAWSPCRR
jgi:hypothetical protein